MILTEQWKNKQLELHKSYYCQNKKGDVCIATFMNDGALYSQELEGNLNFEYWEVLAPVPSYEEWNKSKELLKECKEILEVLKCGSINDLTASRPHARNLLTKINAAIGESEE